MGRTLLVAKKKCNAFSTRSLLTLSHLLVCTISEKRRRARAHCILLKIGIAQGSTRLSAVGRRGIERRLLTPAK